MKPADIQPSTTLDRQSPLSHKKIQGSDYNEVYTNNFPATKQKLSDIDYKILNDKIQPEGQVRINSN